MASRNSVWEVLETAGLVMIAGLVGTWIDFSERYGVLGKLLGWIPALCLGVIAGLCWPILMLAWHLKQEQMMSHLQEGWKQFVIANNSR